MLTHQTKLVSVIKHWQRLNSLGIVPIIEERKPNNNINGKKNLTTEARPDISYIGVP